MTSLSPLRRALVLTTLTSIFGCAGQPTTSDRDDSSAATDASSSLAMTPESASTDPDARPTVAAASTDASATAQLVAEQLQAWRDAHPIDRSRPDWRLALPRPPRLTFPPGTTVEWLVDTNVGTLRFRLFPDSAPNHVANTIYLSSVGFYDGLAFHRIIAGFMAQGGCPSGDGTGGPGYRFAGEFPPEGPKHTRRGLLSMANAGPGTDGSQFFVTFAATPWLDGKHTLYGELVDGDATLAAFEAAGSKTGAPQRRITVVSARTIVR